MSRNFTEQEISDVLDTLPDIIIQVGLFGPEGPRAFNTTYGGIFRCPICGKRLGAYRNGSGKWRINSFGHCPHFEGSAGYFGNAFGLYAALHGLSMKESFIQLLNKNSSIPERVRMYERMLRREAQDQADSIAREITENNVQMIKDGIISLTDFPEDISNLLKLRGIDPESVPEWASDSIGYLNRTWLKGARSGNDFSVEGFVFPLGKRRHAFQIRQVRRGGFVRKGINLPRFITVGPSRCYWLTDLSADEYEPLFISEGPFDALSIAVSGGRRVVATIGAGNHEYLLRSLRNKRGLTAFIVYDPDDTGVVQSSDLADRLKRLGINALRYPINGTEHDANDLLVARPEELRLRVLLASYLGRLLYLDRISKTQAETVIARISDIDEVEDCIDVLDGMYEKLRASYSL